MGYLNFTDALTQAKRNSILTGRPFSMGDYNNLQSAYMSGATARANAARSQALSETSLSNQQANWAAQLAQQKELSAAQIAAQEKAIKRSSSNNLINTGASLVGGDLLRGTDSAIYKAGKAAYDFFGSPNATLTPDVSLSGSLGYEPFAINASLAPAELSSIGAGSAALDATMAASTFGGGGAGTATGAGVFGGGYTPFTVAADLVPGSAGIGGGLSGGGAALEGGLSGAGSGAGAALTGEAAGVGGASVLGTVSGGLGAAGIGAATPGILNAMKSNATREIGRGATLGLVSDKKLSSAIGGGLSGAATGALAGQFLIPVPGLGAAIGAVLDGLGGGIMEGISGFGGAKQHGYVSPELMSSRVAKDYPEYYDQSRNAEKMMPYRTPYEQYVERYSNIMNRNPNAMKHLTQWTPEQLGTYNQAGLMNEKDWYSTYMPGYSAANYPKLVPYYPDRM